jgi:Ger(x)C family germination protein
VAIIALFAVVFFTNDYSLTDIRKTSIVVGLGIDIEEDEGVKLTAQIAVPKASESGENTTFTQVSASGQTLGGAIREINSKAGFYPKLTFCKLILLGESCKNANLFSLLNYFYRNDYTHLTPIVAMCSGEAGELLSLKLPFGDTGTISVERLLSDESKKTGNVSTVNLKCLSLMHYSQSNACYMPYIEYSPAQGGQAQGGDSGQSSSSQSEGGANQSQSAQASGTNQGGDEQYSCTKTAIFKDGEFVSVLDDDEAFALNLVRNEIRHTFIPCERDGVKYTLGVRSCDGNINLKFVDDVPVLTVSFKGYAQLQDEDGKAEIKKDAKKVVSKNLLAGGEEQLKVWFEKLIATMRKNDCDVLGATKLLYRFNYPHYKQYSTSLLADMRVEYDVKLLSSA